MPGGGRRADACGQDGRGCIAADGHGAPPVGVVDERAATELGEPGERVAHSFDGAKRGGGGAQGGDEQDGSSAVGISWPTSASRLAMPIPATPGVSQVLVLGLFVAG